MVADPSGHRVHLFLIFYMFESFQWWYSIGAIHGIGAHPNDTWCKNISQDPHIPPMSTGLTMHICYPSVAPDARILRYRYESSWFGRILFTRRRRIDWQRTPIAAYIGELCQDALAT